MRSCARALAYDANGDETRYLIDPSPTRGMQNAFDGKVRRLTADPVLSKTANSQIAKANPKASRPPEKPTIGGMLWDELRNITFAGEYEAAVSMLNAFSSYMTIDAAIRNLKRAGKDAEAIELCIGTRPDESNAAFERFDNALGKTLDLNQAAFAGAIARAQAELKRAEILDPGLAILIALSSWLGLRRRLKEYDA